MNGLTRTVYHVAPDQSGEKWVVSQERSEVTHEFQSLGEAEYFARQRARKQQPSQVKVYSKDGNIDYESTYGDDPVREPR